MKILFLCKRRPQGRDPITWPYWRFFHLPQLLADYGHEVYSLLLSYQNEPSFQAESNRILLTSENLHPSATCRYYHRACNLTLSTRPDWIIEFSNAYHGILAVHLDRKLGVHRLIDAYTYDNYESHIPWAILLYLLWIRSFQQSTNSHRG